MREGRQQNNRLVVQKEERKGTRLPRVVQGPRRGGQTCWGTGAGFSWHGSQICTRDPLAREGPTMGEVSGGGPSVFTTCPVERFHVKVDL